MLIKEKKIRRNDKVVNVILEKQGNNYFVKCDGEVFYKSPNELFAVERFVSI